MDRPPKRSRCLTRAPTRTTDSAPVAQPWHTIAPGSTTLPRPMRAVDHRAWADHPVVLDDQRVVGQQVQHRVLQDLHPGADTDRAVRVADDLHAAHRATHSLVRKAAAPMRCPGGA